MTAPTDAQLRRWSASDDPMLAAASRDALELAESLVGVVNGAIYRDEEADGMVTISVDAAAWRTAVETALARRLRGSRRE